MKNKFLLLVSILGLSVACDKDYNTIGSEIVGDGNYLLDKYEVQNLKAYSRPTGPVQTNNLPINALGVYEDPLFGTSTAHYVTDLQLERTAPDFGYDVEIQSVDSVYLYIPFFSRQTAVGAGIEPNTFELDSIHGDVDSSIRLRVYHNNYYLSTIDPSNPTENRKYYSDEKNLIESNLGIQLNNSSNVSENEEFLFSKDEIIIYETDGNGNYLDADGNVTVVLDERVVKERMAPGIWLNLDKNFFLNNVLLTSSTNLINNNVFKEHLRGLYFQATKNSGQEGAMAMLDFTRGYVNIQYHSKDEDTADAELKKKAFKLNLRGTTANFFDNNFTISDGEENLYLKGANGSLVYLDIFGPDSPSDLDDVADELQQLRDDNILINNAILTFTINRTNPLGKEPKRIYIFDATNNTPILDYIFDGSVAANPKDNKFLLGGFIETDENGDGITYKIRLTSHINKIINSEDEDDRKNVVLGISLTDNINAPTMFSTLNSHTIPTEVPNGSSQEFSSVPQSSIITPLGTVLYGNHPNVAPENRIKLEIYYTQPN